MSDSSDGAIRVFFYGDYVCPFSYVTDARLRGLLGAADGVAVHWRPLSVHSAVPSDGLPIEQAGYAPDEWQRIRREVGRQADEVGVPLDVPDFLANSREALQAAEFARDLGGESFDRVHRALFRAYFTEGRNLGRREVLLEVCEAAGLDREALEGALEDGRYRDELKRAEDEAERYDVQGTPTLLFGRHKVVGAAPPDVMEEALARARRDAGGGADDAAGGEGGGTA